MRRRRVVLITGASAGIGRAATVVFAREGWDVALLSRDPARLRSAAEQVSGFGAATLVLPADVADAAAVDQAAARTERELGPIAVWINAAGVTVHGPARTLAAYELARLTAVVYGGQAHGTLAALHHMRRRNSGVILCVGAAESHRPLPGQAAFGAAEAARRAFNAALRAELRQEKCRVTITDVDFPAVDTPRHAWSRALSTRPLPAAPLLSAEAAATALFFAATHPRAHVLLDFPARSAVLKRADGPAPPAAPPSPGNLFAPPPGDPGSSGGHVDKVAALGWITVTSRHRESAIAMAGLALATGAYTAFRFFKGRMDESRDRID